jgi:hypothetical protein
MRQIADKIFALQHDLDPCRGHDVVFDYQNAHRVTFERGGRASSH